MKLEIGDNVYCYKNIPLFNKGKFYKIGMITPRGIFVERCNLENIEKNERSLRKMGAFLCY